MAQAQPDESTWQIYKRLLRYIVPHWWILVVSTLGFATYSLTQPLAAQLMKFVPDAIENPTPFYLAIVCIGPVALAFVQGIGQFIGGYALTWLGQHLVFEIRNDAFQHIVRLPMAGFQRTSSGRLMSRIIYDASQVTSAGTDALTTILREGLTTIALLAYLFYLNWKLTLILFIAGPIIGVIVSYTSKRFRKISTKIQGSMGHITQFLSEAFDAHQVVKIFAGQEQEESRFERESRRFEKQNVKMKATNIISVNAVRLTISAGVGVIIYLYIQLMGERISIGSFLAFVTAVSLIQKPIKMLTKVNAKIQRGLIGAASLFELLDEETEPDFGQQTLERCNGNIEFRNVSFAYQAGEPVLKNLNFQVKSGETIALVGRSGAGKSTISSLLPRFYDPTEGDILLDGKPLTDYGLKDLRHQIAMVNQKVVLFADTVRNNIAYGELRDASDEQLEAAVRGAYAWDFIQALEHGFDTELGDDGMQLSGGQRQRIAIARALLKDAPILVLDEATSALDTESEFHIQRALDSAMVGRTTFVIAHRLSTVEKADRILVLDKGQILESGSHQELLEKNGVYTQLYQQNFADN